MKGQEPKTKSKPKENPKTTTATTPSEQQNKFLTIDEKVKRGETAHALTTSQQKKTRLSQRLEHLVVNTVNAQTLSSNEHCPLQPASRLIQSSNDVSIYCCRIVATTRTTDGTPAAQLFFCSTLLRCDLLAKKVPGRAPYSQHIIIRNWT